MANETAIVNDKLPGSSSNLQYLGQDINGAYVYRNVEGGEELFSDSIIEGAKGNPLQDAPGIKQGSTLLQQQVLDISEGLYTNSSEQQSRKYNVEVKTSGDGSTANIEDVGKTVDAGLAVKSKFNRWSLFKTENIANSGGFSKASNRFLMSRSLTGGMGSSNTGTNPILQPTARNIVEFAKESATSLGFDYDLADFIQCEHYGAISNNYMITLRRFPYPVQDDILSPKIFNNVGDAVDAHQPDLARAISWLSPSLGNDLKEILKFKVGYNWEEVKSELQTLESSKGKRGDLGSSIDGNPLLSAVEAGLNGRSAAESTIIRDRGTGFDPTKETYPNKVFGPYNIINSVLARAQGLTFDQDFTITFHYDIKGYGQTSPKAAFMDTLSNLLVLTYSNAPFWGGATRYTGSGSVGKPFGDYNKLKNGDYLGYLGGLMDQFKGAVSNFKDQAGEIRSGNFGNSKILDNIIGGGLMKLFNGPQGSQIAAAFLSGDPTGQWHLTVGNPLMPMLTIGNLAMQDAQFEFEGPLGYEDFPSKLKVTITLKPGRPRDKGEIESMFNAGRGRMYLQPELGTQFPEEQIVDAYGKKYNSDVLYRRSSDMAHG
jgi:hypothetical protein